MFIHIILRFDMKPFKCWSMTLYKFMKNMDLMVMSYSVYEQR